MADQPVRFSPKETILLLPVFGTVFALIFDVGYFWGIDINLFTLFSTSEHIAFALEVLPAALVVVTFVALCPLMFSMFDRLSDRIDRIVVGKPVGERTSASSERVRHQRFIWLILIFASGAAVWNLTKDIAIYLKFLSASAPLILLFILTVPTREYRIAFAVFSTLAVVLIADFLLGVHTAQQYRDSTNYPHTIQLDGSAVKAKIVRSGERGVLFFREVDRALVLIPWTDVKSIMRDGKTS